MFGLEFLVGFSGYGLVLVSWFSVSVLLVLGWGIGVRVVGLGFWG